MASNRWSNWSGSVQFHPSSFFFPATEDELREHILRVASEGRHLRVAGTGHSFTSLVKTEDYLVSLDQLQGLVELDEKGNATVGAGTKLWRLNELLFEKGRGLENLGDIDRQSIAGSISTGTHGTGKTFGTLATQVEELSLLLANGELRTCSMTEDSEFFKAAQVSLGALGVVTRVKLRTLPAYKLRLDQTKETLPTVLGKLDEYSAKNRHFEFFFFPHSQAVQVKLVNQTDAAPKENNLGDYVNDIVMENLLFKLLSEISRWIPGTTRSIARLCGWAVSGAQKTNWAHRIFSTPRWVKFQEMEFNVPAAAMADVVRELSEMIAKRKVRVHFPIECRFVKGDDIWMSPAYGRDSAYIAIHMYKGMEYQSYFEAAQSIFLNHGGRPHWGKMHFLGAKDLRPRYPMWDRFQEMRQKVDPKGVFLNGHLKRLFIP